MALVYFRPRSSHEALVRYAVPTKVSRSQHPQWFVHLWPPAVVGVVDDLDGDVAQAEGPFIRIARGHQDTPGVLEHELAHVTQWWLSLGLHGLLYGVSHHYRAWSELLAYGDDLRAQIAAGGNPAALIDEVSGLFEDGEAYGFTLPKGVARRFFRDVLALS